jgi:hypothetical protein
MADQEEDVRQELRGSIGFVVGVLVSGAVIFSIFFNLCFLAVEYDLRLKRAYLVISNPQLAGPGALDQAILTLDQLLIEDVSPGGRPILCEEDLALLELYPTLKGESQRRLHDLLVRKTGVASDWPAFCLQHLPGARSPFQMPLLELSLLYYGWLIEIATIIFLSQSLRKPHVQQSLHRTVVNPRYFVPLTTLLLLVPAWNWASLVYPGDLPWGVIMLLAGASVLVAFLLHRALCPRLTPTKMNEMGFHLLIVSLFIQLLTVMGDPDVVYSVFSAQRMAPLRYLSWFILACYPVLLGQKWWQHRHL